MGMTMLILAVVGGLAAAVRDARQVSSDRPRVQDPRWLAVALIVAFICLFTALFMIRNALVRWNPFVLPIAVLQLLLSLVAIAAYWTRWRPTIEGLAAAALGVFSFLSGFSIGVFLLPFAVVLALAALIHTDERRRAFAEAAEANSG